jgi:hypothetical protein
MENGEKSTKTPKTLWDWIEKIGPIAGSIGTILSSGFLDLRTDRERSGG